jgi:hypothetical protein
MFLGRSAGRQRAGWILLFAALTAAAPALGQEAEPPPAEADAGPVRPELRWSIEAKSHLRGSEYQAFNSPFNFPGEPRRVLESVDEGTHFEVGNVALTLDADWGELLSAHLKVDAIDLYDRNPTSTDKKVDVDEVWIRFGRETAPATLAAGSSAYLKIGKMPKFERQDDRHLESYGLISTAFNRFEDSGVEAGADLGRHLYLKVTASAGNPVFLRDPNALAGDNGTPVRLQPPPNDQPALRSGIAILYDAEVEDYDLDGDLELGAGLGIRFADEAGTWGVDALAWSYQRTLAETVELEGTIYGGDLDLLDGPRIPGFPSASLPISGDRKREVGGNLWIYAGGFSFFGQWVDQELAGMDRSGYEAELAWRAELPLVWAAAGQQLFPSIAPAVRFSRLEPEFVGGGPYPAVSVRWEWDKLDLGVRLGILAGVDLTLEYAKNTFFIPALRRDGKNDEYLGTLRWRI